MLNKLNLNLIRFIVFLSLSISTYGQTQPPPPGGTPPGFPLPGILYLLMIALGFGVYKISKKRM